MPFLTKLEVTHEEGQQWILSSALVYTIPYLGVVTVPKGFRTDFASIPRVLLSVIGRPTGKLSEPAVLHDFLYSGKCDSWVSRRLADKIFEEAMKENGVSWIKRKVVWSGVRIGGWVHFKEGKDV